MEMASGDELESTGRRSGSAGNHEGGGQMPNQGVAARWIVTV